MKRDIQSLQQQNDALDVIIASLRNLPESESVSLLHSLRSDLDLDVLADTLRTNVNLPQSFGHQTLEADFVEHLSVTPPHPRGGDAIQSAEWTTSIEDRDQASDPVPDQIPSLWFRSPQDAEFVEHLFDLYFSWVHPFYHFFSTDHFLRDMGRGRTDFCSALLVNAILSIACHYSERPSARTDPSNPSTAGDEFFAEARQLLDTTNAPCITTVQALGIMSIRETSRGRDSNGYQYAGRCVRMALEMGLHLSLIGSGLRSAEIEVRKITFWTVFNLETYEFSPFLLFRRDFADTWTSTSSVFVGRLSQLPRAAADVSKPTATTRTEQQPWEPYFDVNLSPDPHSRQPASSILFLSQLSSLSELASGMVNNFYAPREPFTSRRLATAYAEYQAWYQRLPTAFWLENATLPYVLVLHMYYHACVLQSVLRFTLVASEANQNSLFRPYIKLDLEGANLFPRDTCTSSADMISEIMNRLRHMYGLRRVCLLAPSILLSASTIHLLNLPSEESAAHLKQGLRDLQALSTNHRFAARCVQIIQSLAAKWNISLPEGLSPIPPAWYDRLPSPSSSNFWTASIPHGDSFESSAESLVATQGPQESAFLQPIHPMQQAGFPTFFTDPTTEMEGQVQQAFWTPFPSQTMPVPPHNIVPSMSGHMPQMEGQSEQWPSGKEGAHGSIMQFRGSDQQQQQQQQQQGSYSGGSQHAGQVQLAMAVTIIFSSDPFSEIDRRDDVYPTPNNYKIIHRLTLHQAYDAPAPIVVDG